MTNVEIPTYSEKLALHPGGNLVQTRWIYDDQAEQGQFVEFNVNDGVSAYLFEKITLAKTVSLRDIFALIEKSNFLKEYLRIPVKVATCSNPNLPLIPAESSPPIPVGVVASENQPNFD